MNAIFDAAIPKFAANANTSHRYPPWFSREIINNLKLKSYYFKKFKRFKSNDFFNKFKHFRSLCKCQIKSAYRQYLNTAQNSISADPKKLWTFIRNKKGHSRIPGDMSYNDTDLSTPYEIVNAFNDFFSSTNILSRPSKMQSVTTSLSSTPISLTPLTDDEILYALRRSKDSFTAGIDGIPSFILKDCAHAYVLCILIFWKNCKAEQ